jgi:hypothetical protein
MGLQQTSPSGAGSKVGLEVMPAAPGRCASAGTARRRSVRGAALPGRRVHRPPRGRQLADQAPLPTGRIRSRLPSPIPGAGASRSPEPSARCRAGAARILDIVRQPAHLRFRTRLGGRVHPGRMAGGCRGQGLADTPVARYRIAADLPLAHGRDPAGGRRTAFKGLRPHSDGRGPGPQGSDTPGRVRIPGTPPSPRKPSPRTRSLLTPRPPPPTPICVRCN